MVERSLKTDLAILVKMSEKYEQEARAKSSTIETLLNRVTDKLLKLRKLS